MQIYINGNKHFFETPATVENIVDSGVADYSVMAVVLNGNVIKSNDYPQTFLSDGDKIELVPFISGG